LIRHAFFPKTPLPPVNPLAIPVIQTSFRTILMSAIGRTPLFTPGLLPATITAVALSAIAGPADVKYRPALAQPLA
jgi:hypothetical protein